MTGNEDRKVNLWGMAFGVMLGALTWVGIIALIVNL